MASRDEIVAAMRQRKSEGFVYSYRTDVSEHTYNIGPYVVLQEFEEFIKNWEGTDPTDVPEVFLISIEGKRWPHITAENTPNFSRASSGF